MRTEPQQVTGPKRILDECQVWTKRGVVSAMHSNKGCGLDGGSSLPRLLAEYRGVRNHRDLSDLTIEQILAWADAAQSGDGGLAE